MNLQSKTRKWKCRQCGWEGFSPVMKPQESWEHSSQDDAKWIKQLHDLHSKHPEYTKKDLRTYGMMGTSTVNRYWKTFVTGKVHVIAPWSEVME
jgi:hypothetical protein